MYAFQVKEERVNKAMQIIAEMQKKVGENHAYEILFELGFGNALTFDPQGKMHLSLTDLQWCAAAVAFIAAAECGPRMVDTKTGEVLVS